MSTERKEYFDVVNIDDHGSITVLDSLFKHNDSFKGATGSEFEPITEEQIQEAIEYYEGDDIELLCYMADNFGELSSDMIRNVDSSREALIELFFDLSYSNEWDELREQAGLTEKEAVIFNCTGGGRCFDKDFQGNKDVKNLSELIRQYES